MLEGPNPQQHHCENFRYRIQYFLSSQLIQLFQKIFIWPTGKGQFVIVVMWKRKIVLSFDKFSGNFKPQKIYNKTGNKNSELVLRIWPQRGGRGNRLCSFMFAEGSMKAMNTWHSQIIVTTRSSLYLYSTLHPTRGTLAVPTCRTLQKTYLKED